MIYDFLDFLIDFLIDLGQLLFSILIVFVVFILILAFAIKTEDIMNERECYEIYATDNVILKKCERYFDKESDVK